MLRQDDLTADFSNLLPDDAGAARLMLERDLAATLRPARDYFEDRVELLRQWVEHRQSVIGEQWLLGLIDYSRAATLFSVLAEAVVATVLPLVTTTLSYNQGRVLTGRFVVVALGKLGSREMTIQSDLDLLFIYDTPDWVEETDGPEPAATTAYYAKLAQRLIAALTVSTGSGALFEVDMRLRPFGESGPIASSLKAFTRYYRQDAWTWELAALSRARVIAGDPDLAEAVTGEIRAVLTRPHERDVIIADLADMRERIDRQHPSTVEWDCKHRRGGLIDIEFIVQAFQLINAADKPEVLATSTADALDLLGKHNCLPAEVVADLQSSLTFWQGLQGLMRVTEDRAGLTKPSSQLFDKVLLDLTGLDDRHARQEKVRQASAAVMRHYDALLGPARRSN